MIVVFGPGGCGKSTLLKQLEAGFETKATTFHEPLGFEALERLKDHAKRLRDGSHTGPTIVATQSLDDVACIWPHVTDLYVFSASVCDRHLRQWLPRVNVRDLGVKARQLKPFSALHVPVVHSEATEITIVEYC